MYPIGRKFSGVTLNSAKSFFGGSPYFKKCPAYGFFIFLNLSSPHPT
jgi:hypothetical protein